MPIKCAGAPQKAMYLSCDQWRRRGVLSKAKVEFLNAGPTLFGVADYVPPLMEYVKAYGIDLSFKHNLVRVDGPAKTAFFKKVQEDGEGEIVERRFDMMHVTPPQCAPDFVKNRSEEHTSELQSLMRISYAVFCLKKPHIPHNISHKKNKRH